MLVWTLCLCSVRDAFAANAVLVTIRTTDATDPAPYELRLRSELASEGIDAVVANAGSVGGDAKQFASRFGANAVVEVTVSTNELLTLVWTADANLGLEVTRNLRVSNLQRDAVAVFALRTVDLLQGARLDLEQQRRAKLAANASAAATSTPTPTAPASSAPTPVVAPTQTKSAFTDRPKPPSPSASTPPAPSKSAAAESRRKRRPVSPAARDRFRIDLGYVLLLSSDRFGWSTAPALSVAWESRFHLGAGLTASGPFLNRLTAKSGNYDIAIDQEFLQLELRWTSKVNADWAIEPYLAIGASRYAADGSGAKAPLVGGLATAWSLFTVAGATALWSSGEHLHWFADVAGLARSENPSVQIGGDDRTGNSRWNFMLKLGSGWYF